MDAQTIRDARVEILRYLYGRPSAAMPCAAVARAVARAGVEIEAGQLALQLTTLAGLGFVEEVSDPVMPAVKGWKITADGLRHYETHHA